MNIKILDNYNLREINDYKSLLIFMEQLFNKQNDEIAYIKKLSVKIKKGIQDIDYFIQSATDNVCPDCKNVCCISKHGRFNLEDLIYLHAIEAKIPEVDFSKNDSEPCHFLNKNGCSLNRVFRPSGCNWYFCDSLFDVMEPAINYREFDDKLKEIAELWIQMVEEFKKYICLNL